jgi:hypothetical protein
MSAYSRPASTSLNSSSTATERARIAEAGIIDQDDQHIWRTIRRLHMLDQAPVRLRALQRLIRDASKRRTPDRQDRPINLVTHQ